MLVEGDKVVFGQGGLGGLGKEMDVFSLGCVIAEILLDGTPLFDFASLQDYRKGRYDLCSFLSSKISDP